MNEDTDIEQIALEAESQLANLRGKFKKYGGLDEEVDALTTRLKKQREAIEFEYRLFKEKNG